MKSERLQKLEMELEVNVSCMAAGLFPPREKERYLEEIRTIEAKILEEKERLRFMKENGDDQEYVIPKRNPARQGYAEPHTLPDMDDSDMTEGGDMETDHFGGMTDSGGDDDTDSGTSSDDEEHDTDEETDMFSPKARSLRLSQSDLWEE